MQLSVYPCYLAHFTDVNNTCTLNALAAVTCFTVITVASSNIRIVDLCIVCPRVSKPHATLLSRTQDVGRDGIHTLYTGHNVEIRHRGCFTSPHYSDCFLVHCMQCSALSTLSNLVTHQRRRFYRSIRHAMLRVFPTKVCHLQLGDLIIFNTAVESNSVTKHAYEKYKPHTRSRHALINIMVSSVQQSLFSNNIDLLIAG